VEALLDGGRLVLRVARRRRGRGLPLPARRLRHDTLIQALGELRAFLGGQKATLVWDGLPAHRSLAMRVWLRGQRSWLVTEPLPGYALELNPVEGLWASLKGVELANLAGDTLEEVIAAAERGIQRIRATHWLAFAFLRHCGLSLW
jgi:putative transposase